ncbi:MAG TPA: sulfite oxidase [Actinomycetota bacterium]
MSGSTHGAAPPRLRADGVGFDELAQATRNHGMPLEALRYDVTPAGLHYLLIHYDVPFVDVTAWSLHLDGFDHPMTLSVDDLRARSQVTEAVTLECAGNGRAMFESRPVSQPWLLEAVGNAEWTGVPLASVLDEAGVPGDTVEILFTGLDRGVEGGLEQSYQRSLPLEEARRDGVLLAYEMNGQPLLPQHGAPLRLVVPGWYGMTHVKWLDRIEALDHPFQGYQHTAGYRLRSHPDDPGEPVTRILPRSLMVPPGVAGFPQRERHLAAGRVELEGRAWSGAAAIAQVEVSTDGGTTWIDAVVDPPAGPHAWQRWHLDWTATPGEHELACRATDATGERQPIEATSNIGGYANNSVHRVRVTVEDRNA